MEFDLSQMKFSKKDLVKNIKIPTELTEELAEFIGILTGDGCISRYINDSRLRYEIRIDGNSLTDIDYYYHIINLIFKITGRKTKSHFRKQFNGIFIHFYDKDLALLLNKSYDFPIGKKGNIGICLNIINDFTKLKYVLRGLFDTDGSLYFTKNNSKIRSYPIIEITSYSSKMLSQLYAILSSRGFTVKTNPHSHSVKLHGKKNLFKWMRYIGTSHPDKTSKFKFWLKFGHCLKLSELNYKERLNILSQE